ncbi:PepSY domain-containing protein [Lysobacter terrae]
MSRSAFSLASLLLAVALGVSAGSAAAQNLGGLLDRAGLGRDAGRDGGDQDRADRRLEDRHDRGEDHRALSDAVRRVERRTGGQVLSAERVPFDGRNVNRVKVIDSSGRVRVYMDDPQGQGQREQRPRQDDNDD